MARILVLFDSPEAHTRIVAQDVAHVLRSRGHVADVRCLASLLETFSVRTFDGAVLAAAARFGRYPPRLMKFVEENRQALERIGAFFISESLVAATGEPGLKLAQRYVERLQRVTGWAPRRVLHVGGPLNYRNYGPLKRRALQIFARSLRLETDTTCNHDHTNWAQVRAFAGELAASHPVERGELSTVPHVTLDQTLDQVAAT